MYFTPTTENIRNAMRYMGVPAYAQNDAELVHTVEQAFDKLDAFIEPRCVWKSFFIHNFDGGFEIDNGPSIYSLDITRLTAGCNKCILLAATLGHEVDFEISRTQMLDMLDGIALDA